jgi:hypothetical protein
MNYPATAGLEMTHNAREGHMPSQLGGWILELEQKSDKEK